MKVPKDYTIRFYTTRYAEAQGMYCLTKNMKGNDCFSRTKLTIWNCAENDVRCDKDSTVIYFNVYKGRDQIQFA